MPPRQRVTIELEPPDVERLADVMADLEGRIRSEYPVTLTLADTFRWMIRTAHKRITK